MLWLQNKLSLPHCGCCSVIKSYLTLCNPVDNSKPCFPVPHYLPEFGQTHVHWVGDAIKTSHPLLLSSSACIFPSIRVFSNESTVPIKWPRYWTCTFSISPSNEQSGLISFRIDWWSPCCPRDSQKSFLVLQLKSTNSLALSLLYNTSFHYPSTLWYSVSLKC